MFSKTFTVAEDEDFGNIGLKPAWIPESNAGEGSLIAHDMFEHSARARFGAAEEEFMAIGAAYRIRGENGFFSQGFIQRENSDILANDVSSILGNLSRSEESKFLSAPRRTSKLKEDGAGAETVCQQAVRKGIALAVDEWRNDYEDESEMAAASDSRIIMEELAGNYTCAELQEIIVGWMRIGYMNVRRRFPNVDLYGLAYLYENIGKSVSPYTDESYIGCRIRVTVDMKRCTCKVTNLDDFHDY